jgi:hypothetical protein
VGLSWTVKRLIVPTGMRPLTRTDMLDVASPRRTTVDRMSRQVPDAVGASTGPVPLGFLLVPLVLPFLPLVLLLRHIRWLPWTIEARAHPWGRRYPPIVLTYAVRGGEETRRAFGQLVSGRQARHNDQRGGRRNQTSCALCFISPPSRSMAVDPEDVQAIMHGVWDANRKLDDILSYLQDEDDGEEEEETDPDA